MSQSTVQHGTFVIERDFPQPPVRVFAAWASPEAKAAWFAGPAGKWTALERRLDFRIGGAERLRGSFEGGRESDFQAHYHDIVHNRRIVYSYTMHVDGRRISVSLATIEFRRSGEGTRLVLTEQGAYFGDPAGVAGREEGTRGLLESLAAELERELA